MSGSARRAASTVFDEGDIQYPETREYVDGVMDHRAAYRKHYGDELGY